ncbi:MAG: type II toxin-antitoxin system VapC family toxin [Gemmatimonadota bacterium]
MGLTEELGEGRIALDTPVFIYFIEEHRRYLPIVRPVFLEIDTGILNAVTSGLTLLEVLVAPYREGDQRLGDRYEALLTRSRGLQLVPLDASQLRGAARLRARHRLSTPDALQVTAALSTGCRTFLTNDRAMPDIPELRILQLEDFLPR